MKDIIIDTPAWLDNAVCASTDPAIFFPEQGNSSQPAKSICRSCESSAACLAWALSNEIPHGIYGGVTAYERRSLRNVA